MKEEECRRSVGGCRALCKNASWREAGVSSVETTTCDSFTSTLACPAGVLDLHSTHAPWTLVLHLICGIDYSIDNPAVSAERASHWYIYHTRYVHVPLL